MHSFIVFLHAASAILLGFYWVLPFLVNRLSGAGSGQVTSAAGLLAWLNRVGQYVLAAAFLTGGYLVGKSGYSYVWMGVVIVLVLVMFAMSGMMSKPLKRASKGESAAASLEKARSFSVVNGAALVLIFVLMYYPELL